jgi:hypothetical protein
VASVAVSQKHIEIAKHVLKTWSELGEDEARLVASGYIDELCQKKEALTVGKKDVSAIRKAMLAITGDVLIDGKYLVCPKTSKQVPYYKAFPYCLVPVPDAVQSYNNTYNQQVNNNLDARTQIGDSDVQAMKAYCQGVLSEPFKVVLLDSNGKFELLKYLYAIALCSGRRAWEELLFLSEFEASGDDSFLVLGIAKDLNKREKIYELPSLFIKPSVWIQRLEEIREIVSLNDWKDANRPQSATAQTKARRFEAWFHNACTTLITDPSDCRDIYANVCYQRSRLYDSAFGIDTTGDKLIYCGKVLVHIEKDSNGNIKGQSNTSKSYMAYNTDNVTLKAIES